jgi:hypothetical protein
VRAVHRGGSSGFGAGSGRGTAGTKGNTAVMQEL